MVKVYKKPEEFWKEVSPHLLRDEAKHGLALGLANAFRTDRKNCLFLGALFDGKRWARVWEALRLLALLALSWLAPDWFGTSLPLLAKLMLSAVGVLSLLSLPWLGRVKSAAAAGAITDVPAVLAESSR